ncbi:MAG TPA: SGNH/GDSL hydrolase family protein [Tepidisphaeraceae bacterium]
MKIVRFAVVAFSSLVISLGLAARVANAQSTAPVETDLRLQSMGDGWKLNQAVIKDAKLPRVLLIGDSILSGYQKYAVAELQGKAYVDAWVQPHHQGILQGDASAWKAMVKDVIGKGPYDVILFNMGLHGWEPGRIPEGQFKPLTRKLVESLRAEAPNAKLVWLSTTPITKQDTRPEFWKLGLDGPYELNEELNPTIVEHNRLAAEVMHEAGVPIVDLYTMLLPDLTLAAGDMFHWSEPAYRRIAGEVARTVRANLPATKGAAGKKQ